MTDADALLAAVLDRPGDDTPRLVYADWLDDHGDPDRAEFIRVGVQIANATEHCYHDLTRPPDCPVCHMHERAADLARGVVVNVAGDHDQLAWERWAELPGFSCLNLMGNRAADGIEARPRLRDRPGGNYFRFRRGLVDELRVASLDVLLGGECGRCGGTGMSEREYHGVTDDDGGCAACTGTGRTPGIARGVFARHPVVTLAVADLRPWHVSMGGWHWWERAATINHVDRRSVPPPDVFAAMWERHPAEREEWDGVRHLCFDPTDEWERPAIDALSHALVDHCRGLVGLPPIAIPA